MLDFEWDTAKNRSNKKKHGVSFEEASTCFYDPMHILIEDPESSSDELRLVLIGASSSSRLLVVVHIDRQERVRLISARKATKAERREYEEVK